MFIIHGVNTFPRLVARSLRERLRVMPAVVVTGARQTGKSTLAQDLMPGNRRFFSLLSRMGICCPLKSRRRTACA
jgi:predicted AAA+ superfamily ATPase